MIGASSWDVICDRYYGLCGSLELCIEFMRGLTESFLSVAASSYQLLEDWISSFVWRGKAEELIQDCQNCLRGYNYGELAQLAARESPMPLEFVSSRLWVQVPYSPSFLPFFLSFLPSSLQVVVRWKRGCWWPKMMQKVALSILRPSVSKK